MVSLVFFAGGDAAADVPFCFVFLQNFFDMQIQASVVEGESLLDVLMNGTFADAKFLCRVPNGGAVLNDVSGQFTGALFDISFQGPTRSLSRYAPSICDGGGDHAAEKETRSASKRSAFKWDLLL